VFIIPNPPKSFGRQTFSHLTIWYLNFSVSPPPLQKTWPSQCPFVHECPRATRTAYGVYGCAA
jgi:hypothetical protein